MSKKHPSNIQHVSYTFLWALRTWSSEWKDAPLQLLFSVIKLLSNKSSLHARIAPHANCQFFTRSQSASLADNVKEECYKKGCFWFKWMMLSSFLFCLPLLLGWCAHGVRELNAALDTRWFCWRKEHSIKINPLIPNNPFLLASLSVFM